MRPATLLTPEHQYRRHALLLLLGCVLIASVITLSVNMASMNQLDRLGLGLIAVKNTGMFVWLWRRPDHLYTVALTELILEGVGAVARLAQTLLLDQAWYGLGGYSYWMVTGYLIGSLILTPRRFLLVSGAQFGAMLAVSAAFWWSPATPQAARELHGNALLQLLLVHATVIAFLGVQHRLRRQYVQALVSAERQASLAHLDALTGLPNRRQLELWLREHLEGEVSAGPLSVILFDLDHFKAVNDTYGHDAGDRVLQGVARSARRAVREGDAVGRWGGEEFLILVRGDARGAQQVAERLRRSLHQTLHPQVGAVTVSCGVAQASSREHPDALLRRADEALYAAKNAGRDTVRLSDTAA
ncbi:GGDEF domain-containing protein [Deinococcus knuensis]|uniref:GGDEF domain-containing protein n=1 Tax=Deinococcus knuensis TaxID=1837380 RepID=A0ABQ2SHA7_9DEIO|nr:GGDEF domain-containing protein [Deinococcus knuensis]GGS29311.1 GGDEF domain-containing protein [Deinococcus knuensis]